MVKNLRETKSTLSLRPHPEVIEARQRVTALEAQVERLQTMQKREMESSSGSTATNNGGEEEVNRAQWSRGMSPSVEDEKPERPNLADWAVEGTKDKDSRSNYTTPSVGSNLRHSIQAESDNLDEPRLREWTRTYTLPSAAECLPSRPSAMSMSYLEADNSVEQPNIQNKERGRWPVPAFGKMEKYMPNEIGMESNEAERSQSETSEPVSRLNYIGPNGQPVRRTILPEPPLAIMPLQPQTAPATTQQLRDAAKATMQAVRSYAGEPQYTASLKDYERRPLTQFPYPYKIIPARLGQRAADNWNRDASTRPDPETSLFEKFNQSLREQRQVSQESLITKALADGNTLKAPEAYTQPFCDFLTENPTVFHAVDYFEKKLDKAGFKKLSERKTWTEVLERGGKYYVQRNGSSLIAFTVGSAYKSGNGVAMIAGHIDALTAKLKPVSNKKTSAGYVQLGVAPYAGALNSTWWDRDLGIGGRVLIKDSSTGKITTKLVKLGWPIARIPTLAPHFGVGMLGQNNSETQAVPIIGLDNSDLGATEEGFKNLTLGDQGTFAATQPPKLVRAIAGELSIQDYSSIVNWELELYDTQPAQTGGLEKEFIFGGRIDDKLCSWAAMEGLLASAAEQTSDSDGIIKLVGVFDDEEIGSLLRQGARSNYLPSVIERISESFSKTGSSANILAQTYANSFLVSADVTHAVNPNFLSSYLENHAPRLNVGLVVCADSNGHMTTDPVSTALLTRIAESCGSKLQLFMIRNDSRSGGTVGPVLSSAMGVRAIDAGIPQLSMHSIRATTGALDPGLGVKIFKGFLDGFEEIDAEFE